MAAPSISQITFFSDAEIDEIIFDSINLILLTFDEKINDKYIASLEIPYTTKIALQKVNKIVSLATIPHDGNILQSKMGSSAEEFLEFMEPDSEPLPSVIDTWARGVG